MLQKSCYAALTTFVAYKLAKKYQPPPRRRWVRKSGDRHGGVLGNIMCVVGGGNS